MNPKINLVANLKAAGHETKEIARRMGAEVEWVEAMLARPEMQELTAEAVGEDDGTELYSHDEIKFFVEKLFPKALSVIEQVLTEPQKVTAVQWKATEWVLSKAAAIQELTQEKEGAKVINNFIMNDRAAGALEKLAGELGTAAGWAAFEEGLQEMPPGVSEWIG